MEPLSGLTGLMSFGASYQLPIYGAILGELISKGEFDKAAALRQRIEAEFGPEAMKKLEMGDAAQIGPSAFENIKMDPETAAAQKQALRMLQEDASQAGLTDAERADMAEAQSNAAQYEQGQRQALTQNAQATGTAGSGMSMAQQMLAQQAGATRNAQAATQAAGNAARRQAAARLAMGQFASGLRGQEFGEKSAGAGAQDAIARANAGFLQDTNKFNANARGQGLQMQYDMRNAAAQRQEEEARRRRDMFANAGKGLGKGVSGGLNTLGSMGGM